MGVESSCDVGDLKHGNRTMRIGGDGFELADLRSTNGVVQSNGNRLSGVQVGHEDLNEVTAGNGRSANLGKRIRADRVDEDRRSGNRRRCEKKCS